MILQIIISNGILDLVTGILAKISLGTGIWAKFRLGTGIWYPPSRPSFNLVFFATDLWSVLYGNATKAVKFLLNFLVHFALYGQDNYVFERKFMYF